VFKNYNFKDSQIKKILESIVILVDTREKCNNHIIDWFNNNNILHGKHKLNFGDYSFYIPQNLKLDITEDIYFNNQIAIERKANAEEISNNLTVGRDRFKREFERGNGKIRLLIEDSSYKDITQGNYNTKLEPNSFIASLHSFQEAYDSPFFFTDKEHSAAYIYNTFKYYLRNQLQNNKYNIDIDTQK
jgi:ERCC4-type nuclease